MKKIYPVLISICMMQLANAQVNLPHTLIFQNNDANWSDGIAEDGDGGSGNINGLDILIYTTGETFSLFPGSTILWHDNEYYYSSEPAYHGITSGPDLYATDNGVPAMVMRSADPGVNFSLQSILLYEWGGYTPHIIAAYDNGVLVGSIEVAFDMINYDPKTISQNDELTPAFFNNIDEIRFYPKSPNTIFNLSLNNISLAPPVATLPVKLEYFTVRQGGNNRQIHLEWATGSEEKSSHFEIEKSTDGVHFTAIGRVPSQANTGSRNLYLFSYDAGNDRTCYFRLRQVDIDGKAAYSPVIRLDLTLSIISKARPNPTTGKLRIESGTETIREIFLFNAAGLRCRTYKNVDARSYEMNISALTPGTYFLQVVFNGKVEKHTIMKQ